MATVQTYERKEFKYSSFDEYKSHRNEMENEGYMLCSAEADALRGKLIEVNASYEKGYPIELDSSWKLP